MNNDHTIFMDTTGLSLIGSTDDTSSHPTVKYSDPLVQRFLFEAFSDMFPKLEILQDGRAAYHHQIPNTGSFISSKPAESIAEIPHPQVMKLLQGWITLRKLVMESTVPEGVRAFLMDLKIPNPLKSPWLYLVQKSPEGNKKLYVLVGFESPDLTTVSLEEGIAAMLNVPKSQLESLLATSIAPTGLTNHVDLQNAVILDQPSSQVPPSDHKTARRTGLQTKLAMCSLAALVMISTTILMANLPNSKKDSSSKGEVVAVEVEKPIQPSSDVVDVSKVEQQGSNQISVAKSEGQEVNPVNGANVNVSSEAINMLGTEDEAEDQQLVMTSTTINHSDAEDSENDPKIDDMINLKNP